jgi:NAD(P)-dependent dehydrogenase (short-subunit alcohol dehydrogenase family)
VVLSQSTNDMNGRVCIVTGANRGIGKATALGLARAGARVVMVCRSQERGAIAATEIDETVGRHLTGVLVADLASKESIRRAAVAFTSQHDRLDVLVNNAGIITRRRIISADGIETQFAVNHLASFLLTHLLLDLLKRSRPSRIVNVSSDSHFRGRIDFDDLQGARRYGHFKAYCQSKLANVLFTRELARRLIGTGVTVNCLHPGVIATHLLASAMWLPRSLEGALTLFFRNPVQGAQTSVHLATSPAVEGITGRYFRECSEHQPSFEAQDDKTAVRLWQVSAKLAGIT